MPSEQPVESALSALRHPEVLLGVLVRVARSVCAGRAAWMARRADVLKRKRSARAASERAAYLELAEHWQRAADALADAHRKLDHVVNMVGWARAGGLEVDDG